MHPCPSCGLALPASQPSPPYCPHCGAPLHYGSSPSGPGAPPGFGGNPGETTEAPIFGMPEDSSPTLRRNESLQPRRRRQPPPSPIDSDLSGPPSIGLEDIERHNELDLGGSAGSLELDMGDGSHSTAEPPPAIALPDDSGLDFLAPVGFDAGESGLDLPSPVGVSGADVREESNAYLLDLPAPVSGAPAPLFGRPSPPPARAPAPSRGAAPSAAPPGYGPPPALSFDEDLPVPVELDLPTPVADDRLDLPIPIDLAGGDSQMVAPAGYGVTPAHQGLTPAHHGVTPANLDLAPANLDLAPVDLDVAPANLEVAPANLDVRPHSGAAAPAMRGAAAAPRARSGAAPAASPAADMSASPSIAQPMTPPRKGVSRGVLIMAAGLLVVGLAGVGVLYSGILDPDDPEPAALRGAGKKPIVDGKEPAAPDTKVTPSGSPTERAPAVLAKMAAHTPQAYVEALTAAREAGDLVGAAEAGYLLAFFYGPNPARVAEANATLQPHAKLPAAFVQRVVGLAALVAGDYAGAEAALVGDGPRARLYRGWLRLANGQLAEAKADAETVLGALPDEVGARHLVLAAEAQRDPAASVAAIQAAIEGNPHPALRGLLAETAIRTGQLAIARVAVDALDPATTDDPGVQAWIHVHEASVFAAQGDYESALEAFDRALELQPQAPAVQRARIRTFVAARRFNDASATTSALVRERPGDTEAQLLQAEVAIQSGDGDIALQVLEKLAAAQPEDARVMIAKGEVHAMRLEIEDGQAAFAAARRLDPNEPRAAIGEAVLLADAKRLPDALAVLATAQREAEAGEHPEQAAQLLVAKAKLHAKAGERNAALEALDRALELAPASNEAQLRRGVLRLEVGRDEEGRADLIDLFERTGGYPGLAAPLARIYLRDNDFAALERLVSDHLRGEATADDLLTIGARLRLHQSRAADARALIELALARHPSDWEAHMLLAQVLILEGKFADALAEIDRSRPPSPQPERMLQRGKILEFNGRHNDAIPEYQRALALDPTLDEARFLYGRMLHHKGGHAKAITELRKVLDAPRAKSAPWYPEVWLNIGVAQQAQDQYAEAIASLKNATDLDPKLGEAWAKAGRFHGDRNKNVEAIAALEKAVEIGPKEAHWYLDALMDLGRAQSKAGKKAAAKQTLDEFLKTAPPENTSRAEAERLLGEL